MVIVLPWLVKPLQFPSLGTTASDVAVGVGVMVAGRVMVGVGVVVGGKGLVGVGVGPLYWLFMTMGR